MAQSNFETIEYIYMVASILSASEGNYNSINRNDGKASSLGILQWHGCRARDLLKLIINKDPKKYRKLLSNTSIINDINKPDNYWDNKILSNEETKIIGKILSTTHGVQSQNELLLKDIREYIQHGMSLGINDGKCLAFFADLENQFGPIIAEEIVKSIPITYMLNLNNLYKASIESNYTTNKKERRYYTYHRILKSKLAKL